MLYQCKCLCLYMLIYSGLLERAVVLSEADFDYAYIIDELLEMKCFFFSCYASKSIEFLTIGNIRRVGQFLRKNQISNNAEWSNYEALVGPGLCSRQYKLYLQYISPSRRLPGFAIHGTRTAIATSSIFLPHLQQCSLGASGVRHRYLPAEELFVRECSGWACFLDLIDSFHVGRDFFVAESIIFVASGSIAQVHRASLRSRYHGCQIKPMLVAVKVRHPGVGDSIKRDFEIINIVAKISNCIPTLKWLRLDESVQQFSVFVMSQVDLAREAAHLSHFKYHFRRSKNVSFPKPLYPLVHPAVLVETFEHGESVSHYVDELRGNEKIKSALAHIGTNALLKMLLVDNFIHADMHPGNILVRGSQSMHSRRQLFKSKPQVVFLDVGMIAELSKNDRMNLVDFLKAVACRDGQTAAECTLKLSKKQSCPKPEAFIREVKESFDFWGTAEGDLVHPAECVQQLLEQVRHHKVNIDGNVCTVMVTVLVLEGWQRKLDPDYNVMHTLKSLLFKADWAESLSYTIERLMAP
ncbi:probable serine/threonine-protein kinase abkC [Olea europaea var. sylvestris]|uniref:probable serine/threonine-protein kinase abkC n=1 Tax=Olea europaea var. sylvestris TaxID=158386 RepID=UPI000C1D831B|nr:probable serine/threonine-protein kinase abkC [Olea europaea var. sylvestris]